MPAHRLAGFRFYRFVAVDGVVVNRAQRMPGDHSADKACCVPCRPGGQLVFFDQHTVGPAFFRQVVEHANAHIAASNDDNACVAAQLLPSRDGLP